MKAKFSIRLIWYYEVFKIISALLFKILCEKDFKSNSEFNRKPTKRSQYGRNIFSLSKFLIKCICWFFVCLFTLKTWKASNWMLALLSRSRFIISFRFSVLLMYRVMTVKLCLSNNSSPRSWRGDQSDKLLLERPAVQTPPQKNPPKNP